jgi:hypothetical protein
MEAKSSSSADEKILYMKEQLLIGKEYTLLLYLDIEDLLLVSQTTKKSKTFLLNLGSGIYARYLGPDAITRVDAPTNLIKSVEGIPWNF